MELNINSPAYFTQEYGVEDEIYWLCRELSKFVKDKKYSEVVNIIGVTPIVAPISVIQKGMFNEEKKCEVKYGFASVSLRIDFKEYSKADIECKKKLILKNVLDSIKAIYRKAKIDFVQFRKDIYKFSREHCIDIES